MTTAELYNKILLCETIILTLPTTEVAIVKKRLAKKRYKDRKQLGEYADNRRLKYTTFPIEGSTDHVKLRIDLQMPQGQQLNIEVVKTGESL